VQHAFLCTFGSALIFLWCRRGLGVGI